MRSSSSRATTCTRAAFITFTKDEGEELAKLSSAGVTSAIAVVDEDAVGAAAASGGLAAGLTGDPCSMSPVGLEPGHLDDHPRTAAGCFGNR